MKIFIGIIAGLVTYLWALIMFALMVLEGTWLAVVPTMTLIVAGWYMVKWTVWTLKEIESVVVIANVLVNIMYLTEKAISDEKNGDRFFAELCMDPDAFEKKHP